MHMEMRMVEFSLLQQRAKFGTIPRGALTPDSTAAAVSNPSFKKDYGDIGNDCFDVRGLGYHVK